MDFEQGMEAFRTGNFGSAELLLRKVVDSGSDEYIDRAWFHLALSIFNKGRYDAALFEFKSFLNKCKTDPLATEARYWMGECYYKLSDYPNSIEELKRYITRMPGGELVPAAYDRIADMYFSQKRYDEAVLEWEAAISASSDFQKNGLRQYRIGNALFRSGKYDEAERKLAPLTAAPYSIRTVSSAGRTLGRIYQRKGQHVRALQVFSAIPPAIIREEAYADVQYFKACSYSRLGQNSQARALLEAYLATGKDSRWYSDARYELGSILIQGPDQEQGLAMLEEVRTGAPTESLRSRASLALGRFYIDRSPEKALQYLEESLKTAGPEQRKEMLVLLGTTCLRAGSYERAVEVFNLYLKENPFDERRDEMQFLRAKAYLEMGEISRAVDIFESIRKDNPFSKYNTESNYYLALISYKRGDPDKAIELLGEYLKQKRVEQAYEANLLLIEIYLGKGDLDSAGKVADVLSRDFIVRKDVEVALYKHAMALMKNGRDARRFINLILNRFPGTETAAELRYTLGSDNFNRKQYVYALEYFNNYLSSPFTRNRGNAYYKKLLSLYELKRYDDVISMIGMGDFPPMNELQWKEIPLVQARSYYRLNNLDEVYMTLDIASIGDYPKEDVLMYIRSALHVGDYRSAMEANDFLESDKEVYSESLYIIGDYLFRNDKRDESELYFRKIINECPGTRFVERAMLSLGEANMLNGEYQEAVNLLSEVASKDDRDAQQRKASLLTRCYFDMNMPDKAVAYAEENLSELLSSEYGGPVMRRMLEHYYEKKDLQQFDRYAKFLGKYPGNENLINYLSGKIYFETGNYYRAYGHFYALTASVNSYFDESLYHIGLHMFLVARNAAGAVAVFNRLIEMPDANESLKMKARLHLALIYREMNNDEKAKEFLNQILSSSQRGLVYLQAYNLYEEFGYGEK
ncbi:MAG: tetratricopeptide repeat protein [Spirochaetes bacterium]|nr:tetratricopeptide repeat protein [Spirochaetota bacterium]